MSGKSTEHHTPPVRCEPQINNMLPENCSPMSCRESELKFMAGNVRPATVNAFLANAARPASCSFFFRFERQASSVHPSPVLRPRVFNQAGCCGDNMPSRCCAVGLGFRSKSWAVSAKRIAGDLQKHFRPFGISLSNHKKKTVKNVLKNKQDMLK